MDIRLKREYEPAALADGGTLTLVFSAHDVEHNDAVVLAESCAAVYRSRARGVDSATTPSLLGTGFPGPCGRGCISTSRAPHGRRRDASEMNARTHGNGPAPAPSSASRRRNEGRDRHTEAAPTADRAESREQAVASKGGLSMLVHVHIRRRSPVVRVRLGTL